ncbi:DUF4829 domain-containing protein [Bacillus sp. JJ1764]|uniref:DUF4829 domain-containing protein n=1 Tax=Bacillus sp. JJ1764 TaxID=3122964 RepID=UPI002FFF4528
MAKARVMFSLCLILAVYFIVSITQGGKTNNVAVSIEVSDKFSEEEINNAINTVKRKFRGFDGCEMTKLWYSEKDSNKIIEDYLNSGSGSEKGIKAENVIVLLSNFDVDSSGVKEGFNPNSTYTHWNWILVRNSKTENWQVKDWGY